MSLACPRHFGLPRNYDFLTTGISKLFRAEVKSPPGMFEKKIFEELKIPLNPIIETQK